MIRKSNGFLEDYYQKAKNKEIIIGEELRQELENLMADLNGNEWDYDTTAADDRIDFIENCVKLTKSPFYGKPMKLMLFQKAYISALFGFKDPVTGFDRFKKSLFMIARKNGKALDLKTRIPTPSGDKTLEEIKPGDYVYGKNGKPVKVLAESEIFHNHKCYEVTFEDGEKIVCDQDHKWTVLTKEARRLISYKPTTTRKRRVFRKLNPDGGREKTAPEMIENFKRPRADGTGIEYKYRVPMCEPLEKEEKELPLDPYILGLWLGDGDKNDNRLSCGKEDLDTLTGLIESHGMKIGSIKEFCGRYEIRLGECGYHYNDAREGLKKAGVWKNKHIPEIYLEASIEQRVELLKGIMDTDGTVSKAGQCSFSQKSEEVTKGMSRLLSSLGIKHTIIFDDNIKCGDAICSAYKIYFFVDKTFPCFHYPRKVARLKEKLAPRMKAKSIVNIREVESRPTKCICVDAEDGLFLCGERNTVTHNSELCSALGVTELILGNEGSDIVCSSNDDTQASILYDAIDLMRQMIDPEDLDTKRNQRFILNRVTNTKIFKMSERTRNKEGRNIDFAFQDESHELKTNNIPKAIEQSQSLKENPKFINLTTEGFVIDGYLDDELKKARAIISGEDDSISGKAFLPWLYTQDTEGEIFRDKSSWVKSNPTLGTVKKWKYMEEQVELARRSKADRIFVLSKDFNFKQAGGAESWLAIEDYTYEVEDVTLDDFKGCFALGHVDLAETTDLTCAAVLLIGKDGKTKYIFSHFWIPESKLTLENDDHHAGAKYKEWAKAGYITISDGNETDLADVATWFYRLQKEHGIKLYKCGYDQRFSKDWLSAMEEYGWTKKYGDLELIIQNAQSLSSAMYLAEADFKSRVINYTKNPVMRWCLENACIKVDDHRQALCVKTENAKKIDGAVVLINLYEMLRRYRSDMKKLAGG
jgi:phage terminase large subunit-like protein